MEKSSAKNMAVYMEIIMPERHLKSREIKAILAAIKPHLIDPGSLASLKLPPNPREIFAATPEDIVKYKHDPDNT